MVQSRLHATQATSIPKFSRFIAIIQRLIYPAQHVRTLPRAGGVLAGSATNNKSLVAAGGRERLSVAERVPRGAWDSHMHVVDPDHYDLSPEAVYRPKPHSLDQAMEFEKSVGISNIVLVQPSIYGNDNSCLLDALRMLGPRRGRGVVSFDPKKTSQKQLRDWHRLGVRGVRLNIQSVGRTVDRQQLEVLLKQYADAVRPLGWVVQVYVPLYLVELLEPIVPKLNVRFCIDHLGHPLLTDSSPRNPYDHPGFSALVRLLDGDHTYVKLSAPYRISKREDLSDLEPIAREILRLKGTSRVVFATDWPHTRFEGLDIRPWMETVLDWCGNDAFLVDRLFRGNAEDLWDATTA